MSDTKQPQHEAPPTGTFAAIFAVVAISGVMLMVGSIDNLGNVDVNAAPVVSAAPDQIVSPEEHSAFIREGHGRAALEGEDSPLPPTF